MSRVRRFDWLFRPPLADEDLPLSAEARFAEALAGLPAVERSALALSEIGGLDTHEIAERLGTDPVVVRKLLVRARESVRTSLSLQGRRGLAALLPLQHLWQLGSSGPVVRTAGVIAAAIVAPSVVIGGAAADVPRAARISPDPPLVRGLDAQAAGAGRTVISPAAPGGVAAGAVPADVGRREAPAARAKHRSVRPGVGLQRELDAPAVAPAPRKPSAPAADPQRPAAPPSTVARKSPGTVTAHPPLPAPVPPVELPVEPPPLPVLPEPLPELSVPGPPPLPPPPTLP